jgi:UPF0755 protein
MRLRLVAGLVLIAATSGSAWLVWQMRSSAPALAAAPRVVEVPAHASILSIAASLGRAEVVPSPTGFILLSLTRGTARRLKAGEYEVERGATMLDVLRLLESGRVKRHTVLHPEGASVAELARALETARLASAADVLRLAREPAFLRALSVEAPSLEGYLFPDTYQFVRGLTPEEILTRMVQRLRTKLGPDLVARAASRGLSVHQLLTLASIIEREAAARDELRLVSAVFWNRLKLDMPLQADPTVQYAVGRERRALTRADLLTDHPYNTYRRVGLPPGPIASPGLSAIEAALDPAPVKYLYFVAMNDRRHYFSTTVEQHNAAVARYRLARER